MIVPLLQLNLLLMYLISCRNIRCFILQDILYYHDGELILGQILFATIMKPHQEPPPSRDTLHHTSQLLPHPSRTT